MNKDDEQFSFLYIFFLGLVTDNDNYHLELADNNTNDK